MILAAGESGGAGADKVEYAMLGMQVLYTYSNIWLARICIDPQCP
jgi:hypothetical protein